MVIMLDYEKEALKLLAELDEDASIDDYLNILNIDPLCFEAYIKLSRKLDLIDKYKFSANHFLDINENVDLEELSDLGESGFLMIGLQFADLLVDLELFVQAISVINRMIDYNQDWLDKFQVLLALCYSRLEDVESIRNIREDLDNVSLEFRVILIDAMIRILDFDNAEQEVFELIDDYPELKDAILDEELDNENQIKYNNAVMSYTQTFYFEDWIENVLAFFAQNNPVLS